MDPEPELVSGFSVLIDATLEHASVNAGDPGVDPASDSGIGTIQDTKGINGPIL
jgi:hypothetical protein